MIAYNHIEHSVDTSNERIGVISSIRSHRGKNEPDQLNGKQRHARFNQYEYDTSKRSPARGTQVSLLWGGLDLPEHLEDPEYD